MIAFKEYTCTIQKTIWRRYCKRSRYSADLNHILHFLRRSIARLVITFTLSLIIQRPTAVELQHFLVVYLVPLSRRTHAQKPNSIDHVTLMERVLIIAQFLQVRNLLATAHLPRGRVCKHDVGVHHTQTDDDETEERHEHEVQNVHNVCVRLY